MKQALEKIYLEKSLAYRLNEYHYKVIITVFIFLYSDDGSLKLFTIKC